MVCVSEDGWVEVAVAAVVVVGVFCVLCVLVVAGCEPEGVVVGE